MESKFNQFGDILYPACNDRFGKVTSNQRTTQKMKGRREFEIDHLVQRPRQLSKDCPGFAKLNISKSAANGKKNKPASSKTTLSMPDSCWRRRVGSLKLTGSNWNSMSRGSTAIQQGKSH